jgi:hypothetical protein
VAMDPIYLYLVVTNNASGDDLQSTIVMLPKVSSIKQIRFSENAPTIQIDALFDQSNGEASNRKTISGKIEISIPIKDGKLPAKIDAIVVTRNQAE